MNLKAYKVEKNDLKTVFLILEKINTDPVGAHSTDHVTNLLSDDRTYLFAVKQEDTIIGYALAYRFPSLFDSDYLAYLYDIEVLHTHRRIGAGRLLMETLLQRLKADKVRELWLGTAIDNVAGQALFSRTGGIKSGETFNDYIYILNK